MEVLKNEDLSQYTTLRIGGTAKEMLMPHCVEELCEITKTYKDALYISGGSNILIANREFGTVVNLRKFNTEIHNLGDGRYHVGASVRLQRLINTINQDGFGGIENLYSVPGLVGASVAMNAGGGEDSLDYIGNCVTKVHFVRDGCTYCFDKEECNFIFRDSYFKQNKDCIITSVEFLFERMEQEESQKRKDDRLAYCRENQDSGHPNCGSVFKRCSYKVMLAMKLAEFGNKKGVHFSRKTPNWIINSGGPEGFVQAKRLINFVKFTHRLVGKSCETEVIIWE